MPSPARPSRSPLSRPAEAQAGNRLRRFACAIAALTLPLGFPDDPTGIHTLPTRCAAADPIPLPDPEPGTLPADHDWSRPAFIRGARGLEPDQPPEQRAAAARWLAERLAMPAIAEDADAAWQAWCEWVLLPDVSFYQRLAEQHAMRTAQAVADRLAIKRQNHEQRDALISLYRRLYARLPDEEKSPLLIEMLSANQPVVQTAACQLAMRTLQNAGVLDAAVTEAAAATLTSPDAGLRGAAAQLIEQLSPHTLAAIALKQLNTETDPAVAAVYLRTLAGRHRESVPIDASNAQQLARTTVHWLTIAAPPAQAGAAEPPAVPENRIAAFDAAVGLLIRELRPTQTSETTPPDWPIRPGSLLMDQAAAAVTQAIPVRVTPESVALLGQLRRFEIVSQLLNSPTPAVARAAADGLSGQPAFVDSIVRAATNRPELFDAALSALIAHRRTADAFAAALALPASDTASRTARLAELARTLDAQQLAIAMRRTSEDAIIIAAVAPLLLPGENADNARAANWPPATEIELSAMLARARLNLNQSLEVVDLVTAIRDRHLDALRASRDLPDGDARDAAHLSSSAIPLIAAGIEASVSLNRLDQAMELLAEHPALAQAWIAGIDRLDAAQAKAVAADRLLAACERKKAIALSQAQREQLVALSTRPPAPEPAPEPEPEPEPAPAPPQDHNESND